MAAQTVIKEFLVKLGFKIDQNGKKPFIDTIDDTTHKVRNLALGAAAAGAAMAAMVVKLSSNLETLYYVGQRSMTSVRSIQAFSFAFENLGGSAEQAQGILESMGSFLRSNPGSEGYLQGLGVQTRDANGALRETADIVKDLGARLKAMPFYQAKQYASIFGIDEKSLIVLTSDVEKFDHAYTDMLKRAGVNSDTAAKNAVQLRNAMRGAGAAIEVLGTGLVETFGPWATARVEQFSRFLVNHLDDIKQTFTAIRFVLTGEDAMGAWGTWTGQVNEFKSAVIELKGAFSELADVTLPYLHELAKYLGYADGAKAFFKSTAREAHDIGGIVKALGSGDIDKAVGIVRDRTDANVLANNGGVPRGIRNNNPGNIEDGGWAQRHGALKNSSDNRFATFGSADQGLTALSELIQGYGAKGRDTLTKFFNAYAGPNENNTPAYIKQVSEKLGVSADQKLNLDDPDLRASLMQAIVAHENGKNPYAREQYEKAAGIGAASAGSAPPQITQKTEINISSSDPAAAGAAVAGAQDNVNSRLVRNLQGAVR